MQTPTSYYAVGIHNVDAVTIFNDVQENNKIKQLIKQNELYFMKLLNLRYNQLYNIQKQLIWI